MLVDEYHVTNRTRGQYPAAPPTKIADALVGYFCWKKCVSEYENNHLRVVVVFVWSCFAMIFVFGFWILFLFEATPIICLQSAHVNYFFRKSLGKKYYTNRHVYVYLCGGVVHRGCVCINPRLFFESWHVRCFNYAAIVGKINIQTGNRCG